MRIVHNEHFLYGSLAEAEASYVAGSPVPLPLARGSWYYVAGSPVPLPLPRAHPSGWTRTQGLSRMDSHAPPLRDAPNQDVELAAGSYLDS